MLHQGMTRNRPRKGHAQAHTGIQPLSDLTHRSQKFQPLPDPLGNPPYHFSLESAIPGIGQKAQKHKQIIFHTCGDTGGVKAPDYQRGVASAMKADLLKKDEGPSFFYHLGDVVYFQGEISDYYDQFYEPYDQYNVPIIAIPGNHDGEVDRPSTLPSLQGFVRYFMSPTPQVLPESNDAPRVTMSLPHVFFTLDAPFVTVIGIYSNVPEGGSIDSIQQQWLTNEFATAPKDKALIVALHHPIYSFDDHHSGSPRMADVVQHAINDSRRVPNMVLTGHVHNYQRFEKTIVDGGSPTPFLVIGHGGYHHLHGMAADVGAVDPESGATLVAFEKNRHGYVTLTVDANTISGTMTTTDPADEDPTPDVDTFSYPATAIFLPSDAVISL